MFNSEMLVLARARAGEKQSALATRVGIRQDVLSRLESGQREPTAEECERLASALGVPTSFFARDPHERFVSAPPLFRLKRKKVRALLIDQLNAWLTSQAMHVRDMLRHVDIEPALVAPQLQPDATPEEAAATVRRLWLVRPGPMWRLTHLIEAAGILVVEIDPPVAEFEGCAFRSPHLPPCIFVSRHQSPDRRRLTLAHELAHLVMHDSLADENEAEAFAFAGALLAPRDELLGDITGRRINLNVLLHLKLRWGMSMAALIKRLQDLHALSKDQVGRLYQELNFRDMRRSEPGELPRESPELLNRIVTAMRHDLGYTTAELAALLREIPETVARLYPEARGPLQLA